MLTAMIYEATSLVTTQVGSRGVIMFFMYENTVFGCPFNKTI
jgi:hypothetical protein